MRYRSLACHSHGSKFTGFVRVLNALMDETLQCRESGKNAPVRGIVCGNPPTRIVAINIRFQALYTEAVRGIQNAAPDSHVLSPERKISDGDGTPCRAVIA